MNNYQQLRSLLVRAGKLGKNRSDVASMLRVSDRTVRRWTTPPGIRSAVEIPRNQLELLRLKIEAIEEGRA